MHELMRIVIDDTLETMPLDESGIEANTEAAPGHSKDQPAMRASETSQPEFNVEESTEASHSSSRSSS